MYIYMYIYIYTHICTFINSFIQPARLRPRLRAFCDDAIRRMGEYDDQARLALYVSFHFTLLLLLLSFVFRILPIVVNYSVSCFSFLVFVVFIVVYFNDEYDDQAR